MTMYKLIKNPLSNETVVFNKDTNTSFLESEGNPDYQAYLKWLAEGNTPEAADAP